jgi:hypothetical protein
MLEEVKKLEEILKSLLDKKELTAKEAEEISEINEKINQAAEIKQQFIMGKALADILTKIEELSQQDKKKAEALKEKLEEMRKSDNPEEVEEIIEELKEILNTESSLPEQEESNPESEEKELEELQYGLQEESNPQWEIYILSPSLVVSAGSTMPLKVIATYQKGYIKELSSDVEWFSSDPRVAVVDEFNFLHVLSAGQCRVRAAYKGSVSKDQKIYAVEDINKQTMQAIKQELE